jgi:AraC-like DNA-binding protein
MKLVIGNLVCKCCTIYVSDTLNKLGLHSAEVSEDGVTFPYSPSDLQLREFERRLNDVGLEIVREKKNLVVERMKFLVKDLQAKFQDPLKINLSVYLSEQLNYNYSYLSKLFSETEGITLREFCINLRIEQVKRMLVVDGLDLMDISVQLNYSSVAHLASQFKKVTGLTSTEYKKQFAPAINAMRMAA